MSVREFFKNREKRRRIAHIIASCLIFFHAYERYEHGNDNYVFFIVGGVLFLLIALFHPIIEKKAPWIDGLFLTIEGLLSFVIAADFFHLGKKALPIAYICVGIFQILMAFRKGKKGIQKHHQTAVRH